MTNHMMEVSLVDGQDGNGGAFDRDDLSVPEMHRLKVDVKPMSDLLSGNKTCEIRRDDRGFEVGDHVHLTCSDGRETDRIISHIQRGYGLPGGLCVLSYRADLAAPSAPVKVAGLVADCMSAAEVLSDFDTFQTAQGILLQAAAALEASHAASAAKDAQIAKLTARADNLARFEESHRNQANEQFHRANRKQARAERAEAALAESEAKLAVAYETAARVAYHKPDEEPTKPYNRHGERISEDIEGFAGQVAIHDAWQTSQDIRALDPDATAALAAYVKQAVEAETRAWRDLKECPDREPNIVEYSCADNGCFEVEPSIWMHHPYDPTKEKS